MISGCAGSSMRGSGASASRCCYDRHSSRAIAGSSWASPRSIARSCRAARRSSRIRIAWSDTLMALWLRSASWLLVAGAASILTDFVASRDAMNQLGGALFDVSASRIAWALSGSHATDVLAKGCPLDFHSRAFGVGACAQSVYGHINVLVEKRNETPTFTLMVAHSFARDVGRTLGIVAAQYGFD